jgi:hypothetical protein
MKPATKCDMNGKIGKNGLDGDVARAISYRCDEREALILCYFVLD